MTVTEWLSAVVVRTVFGLTEGEFTSIMVLVGTVGAAIIAGLVTLIVQMMRSRSETRAIKTATTVNHHASNPPTLKDDIATVRDLVAGLAATVEAHHKEQERRNNQQDERLSRGMVRFSQIEHRMNRYHGRDT